MKELNNSIYHEPGVGLLALVEYEGVRRFCTLQGLASRIELERRRQHDVSQLVEALDELYREDRNYQQALWMHDHDSRVAQGEDAPDKHK